MRVISGDGAKVIASASTLEAEVRKGIKNGGNVEAAAIVGARIAESESCRHRYGRIRSFRFPLPRSQRHWPTLPAKRV